MSWSHAERSWSSSSTSSPAASTLASRREWCSSISASNPSASGSEGIRAVNTRVNRIASSLNSVRTSESADVAMYPSLKIRYSTASTPSRRSGNRSLGGTRYGIPASRIFRFARTRRWATVGSDTRKARAISGVVSPPSVRSVRATRESSASAG